MNLSIILESYLIPMPALEAAKYTFGELLMQGVYILTIATKELGGLNWLINTFSKKPDNLSSDDIAECINIGRDVINFVNDKDKSLKVLTRRAKLL